MPELLRVANLAFSYGSRPALRDVSLTLSTGELLVIIGPNGSGKSTLIRALLGQLRAAGQIDWEAKSLLKWNPRQLARRIAYLPQSPTADLDQSVEQVLHLGRAPYWKMFGIESAEDQQIVADVARELELTDLLERRLAELSGGQRQRVFIGRCLVQQPIAMLLDEPSTFLDLKHQIELLKLLKRLTREKSIAVLMASHDVNLAATFADQMVVLETGQVVATGSPTQVMQSDLLARVYGMKLQLLMAGSTPIVVPVI